MSKQLDIINQFVSILSNYSINFNDEKDLQESIFKIMQNNFKNIHKEYSLEPYGIVDFFIEGVAIEVKIKGQKAKIYRQCRDYCKHQEVSHLLLVSTNPLSLPEVVEGKRCYTYQIRNIF